MDSPSPFFPPGTQLAKVDSSDPRRDEFMTSFPKIGWVPVLVWSPYDAGFLASMRISR